MGIKNRYPYKPETVISKLYNTRLSGELDQDEWQDIVGYMYSEDDAQVICESIQEVIADKQEKLTLEAKKLPRAKGGNIRAKAALAY